MTRFLAGLVFGIAIAAPIAGAIALAARTDADAPLQARHDSLDAELRTWCALGVTAGERFREAHLRQTEALGLLARTEPTTEEVAP